MGDDIIRIGWLKKSPPPGALKGWKRRFFSFKRGGPQGVMRLEYYPDSSMSSAKGVINLNDCTTVTNNPDIGKHKFLFQVVTSQRVFLLEAASEEERLMWVDTLAKELFQNNNAQPANVQVPVQPAPVMSASTASPPMPTADAPRRTSISYKRQPAVEQGKKLERPYHPQPEADSFPWLYGVVSRQQAEQLLSDYGLPTGLFLIRRKNASSYAISVSTNGKIVHHLVAQQPDASFTLNGKPLIGLSSLEEVVDYLETPKGPPLSWKHSLTYCPKVYDQKFSGSAVPSQQPPALAPRGTTTSTSTSANSAAEGKEFVVTIVASPDTQAFGIATDQPCLLAISTSSITAKDTTTGIALSSWSLESIYDYGFDTDTFFFKSNSSATPGHFRFLSGDSFDIVSCVRANLPTQKGPKAMSMRVPATQPQVAVSGNKFATLTSKKPAPKIAPRKPASNASLNSIAEGDYEDPIDADVLNENEGKPLPPVANTGNPKSKFDANFLQKMNSQLQQPPTLRPKSKILSSGSATDTPVSYDSATPNPSKRLSVQEIGVAMVGNNVDIGAALSGLKKTSTIPNKPPPAVPSPAKQPVVAPKPPVQQVEQPQAQSLQRQDAMPEVEGVLYLAGCDYDPAGAPGKLAFKEGDVVNIVKADNDSWWLGMLNGKRGWVPANYMDPLPADDEAGVVDADGLDADDEETQRALAALGKAQSFTNAM